MIAFVGITVPLTYYQRQKSDRIAAELIVRKYGHLKDMPKDIPPKIYQNITQIIHERNE